VHQLQVVQSFPTEAHDLPVSLIVTPDEVITVESPPPPPEHIDWTRLPPQALREMPVLQALRARQGSSR
jgi:5-formyltetrahydrofolate cyclo-ligase